MSWSYCERWNKMLAKPITPLTEDEARARHERGELYTAYSEGTGGQISVAVEVRLENGFVGIWDFDRYRRPVWRRVLLRHGEKMFMEDATSYSYGNSEKLLTINQAEQVLYRHVESDGTGVETRRRKGDSRVDRTEISLKEGHTLNHYWTPIPTFGQYDEACWVGIDQQEAEEILRDHESGDPGHSR